MDPERTEKRLLGLIDDYYRALAQSPAEFKPGKTRINYGGPIFASAEVKAVVSSLFDGRLAIGKSNRKFEEGFAEYIGSKYAVTANSGSSSLIIAFGSLMNWRLKNPLKREDRVITTAMNHPATVNGLLHNGLTPLLVDVDPETLVMDTSQLDEAVKKGARGILAMHFMGNPCDMGEVMRVAKANDLYVVEDCCDGHGSTFDGKKVGSIGDLGCFSFYASHQIAMGEGGAVTGSEEKYLPILRSLRGWGVEDVPADSPDRFKNVYDRMPGYDRRYLFWDIAYNMKIVEYQAAFGLAQLKRIKSFVERRRKNREYLSRAFSQYPDYISVQKVTPGATISPYGFVFMVNAGAPFTRFELATHLEKKLIETRYLFAGDIRDQPAYQGTTFEESGDFADTRAARDRGLMIGCHPGMEKRVLNYMIEALDDFIAKHKN